MKKEIITTCMLGCLGSFFSQAMAQGWSYQQCVDYANEHNIQLQQSLLNQQTGTYDLEAAKAQWFPTLSASTSQQYVNYPSPAEGVKSNSYHGSYGLNADWTLFDGGKRSGNIKKSELQNQINALAVDDTKNSIRTQILVGYLQILYAEEAIDIAESAVEVSKTQMERAEQLMQAGRMSRVDYTQLESQYHSDLYSLTSAQTNLESKKMVMKQLLQLGIDENVELEQLTFSDEQVMQTLPNKGEVYAAAVDWMPGLKSSQLEQQISEQDVKIAKSGRAPRIGVTGSVATNNGSDTGYSFGDQLKNGLHEQIGVSLSYNILDNKEVKTAVAKAQASRISAELEHDALLLDLSQNVESAYLEAQNAQAKYVSGKEKLKSASLTDELTNEQFRLGLVNTLDLLSSHSNLVTAKQELLQAKYLAILNIKMLDYYQNKPIVL